MRFHPSKFRLGDGVSLAGRAMRVAGVVQYESDSGAPVTRYLLAEPSGAPAVIEEAPEGFVQLGTFPTKAQPSASGDSVSVMGEKYALRGLRKLKLVGTDGLPPGGAPKGELLLTGEFEGSMGSVVRELVPGIGTQSFYLLKRLSADDVLSNEDISARLDAGRRAAEAEAMADEEEPRTPARLHLTVIVIVAAIVAVALIYSWVSAEDEAPARPGSGFYTGDR
jgi:hypothetical protein